MEYWNNGKTIKVCKPNIPLFHRSIIPGLSLEWTFLLADVLVDLIPEMVQQTCHGHGRPGCEFKTCLPGGASTLYLPKKYYDVEMDFDSVKKVGNRLGTGAIIVFDQKTCLVAATLNLIEFFVRESCGWCTPCREALPFIRDLLCRIEAGEGKEYFIPMLQRMSQHTWKSYCAFAPGATMPVTSLLDHFLEEVHEHISQKKCPYRG